jgi:copper chaperone
MRQATLHIDGMHCASCALLIDEELEDLPGVSQAKTSYAKQRTDVSFDDAQVGLPALVEAIGGLGYSARHVSPTGASPGAGAV